MKKYKLEKRPICGANCGPGARISDLLIQIITLLCEEFANNNLIESTEDLQARIMNLNFLREGKRWYGDSVI